MTDLSQAQAYVTALTGSPDTVMDWRVINDRDKGAIARNLRGSLAEVLPDLTQYNQSGWGIFVCINAMDGVGRELTNVQYIRAHVVDLDNPLTSADGYNRAVAAHPKPHFAVQTSPNKFHLYWLVEPYVSNECYTMIQRKLAEFYDGDRKVVDATRVLRVPGFYHLKGEPFMVRCWGLGEQPRWPVAALADSLAHVNVVAHVGHRSPLGTAELQAPSLDWLKHALNLVNPNDLAYDEWVSLSAAFKQAGWTLAPESALLEIWQHWCSFYEKNDTGENIKLWNSVRDTEVGWGAFERRTSVSAHMISQQIEMRQEPVPQTPKKEEPVKFKEFIEVWEYDDYFKDCYLIGRTGEVFNMTGRYMNQSQFNALYGGHKFVIDSSGKTTDMPWKAALFNTKWQMPKVDHIRFLPTEPPLSIVKDELGRAGLNTYLPVHIEAKEGDVSRWLDHMKLIIPDDNDRRIFIEYMAHCIKYPGHKIPWAPLLQSVEGVGKGMIRDIMKSSLGSMYVYTPKATELASSGSKFNAWMRAKLCIIVDEIKVDERRELIEILKPMITDPKIEIQSKGVDQEMEDNVANWIFFSNHKDAIPINQNGRRYAIFYSPFQTKQDKRDAGIDRDQPYFREFYKWLDEQGGWAMITHYLRNYPIEKGDVGVEAPETSSYLEAVRVSRSPMQVVIEEAIQDGLPGFRGGYVSSIAVARKVSNAGMRSPSAPAIKTVLEGMGYHELGRAGSYYPLESADSKATIYSNSGKLTIEDYGRAQGY